MTRLERVERQAMLSTIYEDIRKEYYDPKFHGLDWSAKFAEAKQNVAKANTKTEANLQIAAMLAPPWPRLGLTCLRKKRPHYSCRAKD